MPDSPDVEMMRAEFAAWLSNQTDDRIELYIANPSNAIAEFEWYLNVNRTAEEQELVQLARSELDRRKEEVETRRWEIVTAIAIAGVLVALVIALVG